MRIREACCTLRVSVGFGLASSARYGEAIRVGEENLVDIRDPDLHPHLWVAQHLHLAFCYINYGDWDRAAHHLALAPRGAIGGDIASGTRPRGDHVVGTPR